MATAGRGHDYGRDRALNIYFINLDRSPGRLDWFMAQVAGVDVATVRVPAVDAKQLPDEEFERLRRLSSGVNSMSPAEMACLLSHRKAWALVAEGEDDWAFVAEDDIHFSADAANFLNSDRWIPAGVDIVRAETDLARAELSHKTWGEPAGHELRRLKSAQLGSAGYFVSRSAARRLLDHTERHCEPADVILYSPEDGMLGEFVVLQLMPAFCIQDMWALNATVGGSLTSQIAQDRRQFHRSDPRSARRRGMAKLTHEFWRVGRQLARPFRMALLATARQSVFKKVSIDLTTQSDTQRAR
ncbi:glycosyltransferase family 25 protein [Aminobacter anthyllidis]|nr:glycosyltransferase family 25 protein [Aminobacter anthyllidis]